jgi:hypothetical protein
MGKDALELARQIGPVQAHPIIRRHGGDAAVSVYRRLTGREQPAYTPNELPFPFAPFLTAFTFNGLRNLLKDLAALRPTSLVHSLARPATRTTAGQVYYLETPGRVLMPTREVRTTAGQVYHHRGPAPAEKTKTAKKDNTGWIIAGLGLAGLIMLGKKKK